MLKYIESVLELHAHEAVPMITPTWRDNCTVRSVRVRCDGEELARHVLHRLQYANIFFNERTHLVQPIVGYASEDFADNVMVRRW